MSDAPVTYDFSKAVPIDTSMPLPSAPGADLRQSLSYGVQQDPDEYAKLMRQQQVTGMAPQVSHTQYKDIQQTIDVDKLNPEQMVVSHPRTAAWASNVDNASVAGADEIERLKYIEEQSKAFADPSLVGLSPSQRQEVIADRMRVRDSGAGTLPGEAAGVMGMLGAALLSPVTLSVNAGAALVQGSLESLNVLYRDTPWEGRRDGRKTSSLFSSEDWATLGAQLKDVWTRPRQTWVQQRITDPMTYFYTRNIPQGPQRLLTDPVTGKQFLNPDYRWWGRPVVGGIENVPGQVVQMMAGNEVGALGEAALGAEGAGLGHQLVPALLSTQAAQNTYAEAREKGADQKAAIIAAIAAGATTYAIMGKSPAPVPTETIMGALGQWGARSAAMSYAQTTAENALAKAYYDPDRGAFQGLPQSMITMAAFESLGAGPDILGKTIDAVAESKLRTRSPEMFKSAMEHIFAGQESVQIPAQDFISYYQSKGLDPAEEAAKAGVTNLEEAAVAGTNLEIPKDNFFGQVDPEHQKGLLPDIVDPATITATNPTGMTSRQVEARKQELKDWVEQAGPEKLAELTQAADEQTQASPEYQEVLNNLRLQYGSAGFAPEVAESYATLHANWYMNLAREAGLTPTELLRMRMPMIVAGEAPEAYQRYNQAAETIRSVVEAAKQPGDVKEWTVYAPITDWLRDTAKKRGLDLEGFQHGIDADAVRHSLKKHGDAESETQRGQVAITDRDFEDIPRVVSEPDRVIFGGKTGDGLDTIAYVKKMADGSIVHVEEARTGRKRLAAVSMWKHPATADVDSIATHLHLNVQNDSGRVAPIIERGPRAGKIKEEPLLQDKKDQPRGWFRERPDGSYEIGRTRISDPSTLIHEPAHSYLELFRTLTQREGASEQIKNDFQKICEWLGTTPEEVLKNGFTREQHEQWARGNELYVREGKAPSKGLRAVFQRFAVWLGTVYKKASELGVELSPEVREIMDRYYASEEGVNNADAESAPKAFNSPDEAGWTEEKFQKYAEQHGMEVDEAKQKIISLMNEASLRERTDAWQEEERNVRQATTDQVDASPAYTAIRSLRRGALDDGTEITLNRDELIRQFGEDRVRALQKLHPGLYRNEGGTDAQGAAEALGYTSGEEMLRALENSPRRAQAIEQATRDYMTQKHGDIRYDGSLQDKARLALANDQRAERLHTELQALAGRNTPEGQLREAQRQLREIQKTEETEARQEARLTARDEKIAKLKAQIADLKARIAAEREKQVEGRKLLRTIPPIEAFRAAAQEAIAGKRVADLQPMRYLEASRKFGSEALRALARGDYEGAKDAKQKELLNHFLFREAADAKEYIGKVERDAQRFNSKGIQQKLGKASLSSGFDYLGHFNNLLMRYGLRPGSPQKLGLAQWAQSLFDAMKEPAIDPRLMDEGRVVNYRDASVDEVRAVHDALKNIRKMAYQELGMIVHGRKVEFDAAIDALENAARTNVTEHPRPVLRENIEFGQKRRDFVGQGAALVARMQFVVNRLDGGMTGPWHDFLWNLAADSQGVESTMSREVTKAIGDALEKMPKEMRKSLLDKVTIPGIREPVARRTLIAMALNMGNESNLDRLTKTFEFHNNRVGGWDPRAIEAVKTALTREEWTFVQDTWNTLESLGKRAFEFEARMNGLPPVKIHAAPFDVQLADGSTMHLEGGYYPVAMDPDYSLKAAQPEAERSAQNIVQDGYGRATLSKSYTKERKGFGGPLLFDYEQVLTQHLAKIIKDMSHREFLLTATKIVSHPKIRRALIETLGPGYEEQMMPWLKTIINDRNGSSVQGLRWISKGINTLRTNVVKAALGLKFNTILLQITHSSSMFNFTSRASYQQALIDFLAHPIEMTQQIKDMSPNEMANRGENLDRDYRKVLQDKAKNVMDVWAHLGMTPARYMDHLMSFPLWLAVHRDTMLKLAHLPEEEAKYQAMHAADSAVTMGLGANAPKDLPPIMRNNDLFKFLTTLGGFHNLKWNQISDVAHTFTASRRGPSDVMHLTYGMVMAAVVPALLGAWISGKGPDKDENVGVWAAKRALLFPVETLAIIGTAVQAIENRGDVRLNPIVSMVERAAKAGYRAEQAISGATRRPDWTGIGMDLTQSGMEAGGISGTDQLFKTLHYLRQVGEHKIKHPSVWGAITGAPAQKHHR